MTLGQFFSAQELRIKATLRQPVQTFTKTENPRNVFQPMPVGADPVADFRHGTVYAYERHKCRCEKCREAKKQYAKKYATGNFVRMRNFRPIAQPSLFQSAEGR